jgi:peptidoglycan/LPS O-acetylase OafA/YrhL
MHISILDAPGQGLLFGALFLLTLILTVRPRTDRGVFPTEATNELKGLAIIAIIIAHIGFFLADDTRFLTPLSYFAGIGVDLFLFLSGYGLTASSLKKNLGVVRFYTKRLFKLFIPLWVVLAILFVLHSGYDTGYIIRSFLGWFPHADLYQDVDSPLWYFSLILFYYLIYPLVFNKRLPYLSALAIGVAGYLILYHTTLPVTIGVLALYKLHFLAFPLGMLGAWVVGLVEKQKFPRVPLFVRTALAIALLYVAWCAGTHGGFGQVLRTQQLISLAGVLAVVGASMLKPIEFKAFAWWGVYSYEIYLLHWPLLYHYDFVYKFLPPGLATLVYLFVFIALGYILQRCIGWLTTLPRFLKPKPEAS